MVEVVRLDTETDEREAPSPDDDGDDGSDGDDDGDDDADGGDGDDGGPNREPLFHLPADPPTFLLQSQHLRCQRPSSEIGSTHSFEAKLNQESDVQPGIFTVFCLSPSDTFIKESNIELSEVFPLSSTRLSLISSRLICSVILWTVLRWSRILLIVFPHFGQM